MIRTGFVPGYKPMKEVISKSACLPAKTKSASNHSASSVISSQLMKPTAQIPMLGLVGKQSMLLAAKGTSGGKDRLPCRI